MLLDVKRATTAASAECVRLVVALAKAGCSLRHLGSGTRGFLVVKESVVGRWSLVVSILC